MKGSLFHNLVLATPFATFPIPLAATGNASIAAPATAQPVLPSSHDFLASIKPITGPTGENAAAVFIAG
jgi:hypothetical protein